MWQDRASLPLTCMFLKSLLGPWMTLNSFQSFFFQMVNFLVGSHYYLQISVYVVVQRQCTPPRTMECKYKFYLVLVYEYFLFFCLKMKKKCIWNASTPPASLSFKVARTKVYLILQVPRSSTIRGFLYARFSHNPRFFVVSEDFSMLGFLISSSPLICQPAQSNSIEIYQRSEKNTTCKLIRPDPDPISFRRSNWLDLPNSNLIWPVLLFW
jgi:hypothetical protein